MAQRVNLDGKFHGVIVKNKNGVIVPPDEWMVFLAKDDAFPPTLKFYRKELERQGAELAQLASVDGIIKRVDAWRADNPTKCKTPDIETNETIL